jgi:small subunit ribosomal protein S6
MRDYEIMLVLDSSHDEKGLDAVLKKFESLVTQQEGTITNVDKWGKRRLAYPINKKLYGYYVVLNATMPGAAVQQLRSFMSRSSDYLRYMFFHLDDRTKKLIAKQEQVKKRQAQRRAEKSEKEEAK